jgi:hypothetical protein
MGTLRAMKDAPVSVFGAQGVKIPMRVDPHHD